MMIDLRRTFGPLLAGLSIAATVGNAIAGDAPDGAKIVDVQRIWSEGEHNAFTDLVRFKDRWFCTLREGHTHDTFDGKLRVLGSDDGRRWASVALLTREGEDLRDPNFCITPHGRLMLITCARWERPRDGQTHQSLVYFSEDGRTWSPPHKVGDPNVWMWSATSHDGHCYCFGYHTKQPRFIRLYRSADCQHWETIADDAFTEWFPNENSLVFADDGTCFCLLKCSAGHRPGHVGTARPPYTDWTWKDLHTMLSGGPKLIRLPNGRLLGSAKLWEPSKRLSLFRIDPAEGSLQELLALPAGGADWYGDFSYPGMVWHDGLLWVSYYSGHEGKTSIYLARVRVDPAAPGNPDDKP